MFERRDRHSRSGRLERPSFLVLLIEYGPRGPAAIMTRAGKEKTRHPCQGTGSMKVKAHGSLFNRVSGRNNFIGIADLRAVRQSLCKAAGERRQPPAFLLHGMPDGFPLREPQRAPA